MVFKGNVYHQQDRGKRIGHNAQRGVYIFNGRSAREDHLAEQRDHDDHENGEDVAGFVNAQKTRAEGAQQKGGPFFDVNAALLKSPSHFPARNQTCKHKKPYAGSR